MHKIEIKVHISNQETSSFHVFVSPSSWREVTGRQLVQLIQHQPDSLRPSKGLMQAWMEMPDNVASLLLPSDWYAISHHFAFALRPDEIDHLIISRFSLPDGQTLIGPADGFDGMTWEEFVYADTYAAMGQWERVAAVLYRPQRTPPCGEADPRLPFSRHAAGARVPQIAAIDKALLQAIALNYRALRMQFARRWPRLFHIATAAHGKGNLDAVNAKEQGKKPPVSWLTISRHLLTDHFYEEEKLMRLPVGSVMFQLNEAAKPRPSRKT